MPNRTNCVTSWGIRYEFDLTNTPPSVDRFYRGTVCLSSEKGKKNGREYDRNVPSNLAFPLKLPRRVKVASRRGLFLPFAQVSARTIAFRPFFFLSFFFSRVSWRNSVPPGDHRVIEQTNETFQFFLPPFFSFFALVIFFFFFLFEAFAVQTAGERNWKRGESCPPPRKEIQRWWRGKIRGRKRENLILGIFKAVMELLLVSKRLEILFVIFLGSFWLRENCMLQKSLVRGGRKLGVFTRREMSRSLNFNPVSIGNKMKDRLLLSFSRSEAKYYILFSNEEKRLFVAYTILRAIKII